ncbi:MAG TPA: hypothetical protein VGI46_15815, partial [Candidatus Acidoferrum sp.]
AALINDSYNSSPAALHAMVSVLAATPNFQRRILAVGEMRELGAASLALHHEAGIFVAKAGNVDWVIGVEGHAQEIVAGAVAAGIPRERTRFFSSSDEAAKFLEDFFRAGDVLLVKGSRGVKMERIVETLLGRYAAPGEASQQEVQH